MECSELTPDLSFMTSIQEASKSIANGKLVTIESRFEYINLRMKLLAYFLETFKKNLPNGTKDLDSIFAGGLIPYLTTLIDTLFTDIISANKEETKEKINKVMETMNSYIS